MVYYQVTEQIIIAEGDSVLKKFFTYTVIALLAIVNAFSYKLFIFPNQFAPSGLNGLCTMFQYVTHMNMGYLNLILNVPLAIAVYYKVSKSLALRALTYVATFSVVLLLLDKVDFSQFAYVTDTGTSTIVGPVVGGVIYGCISSVLLKAGTYSGGTDFVGSLIHKNHPEFNFFYTVFAINVAVACLSYFVYGYKLEPVLMCILYSFTSSTIIDRINKAGRSAVRYEIITERPEELSRDLIAQLHHSVTQIPAKGMYSGKEKSILLCVVNKSQTAAFAEVVSRYPDSFVYSSQITQVMGNFKRLDNRGKREVQRLDYGDGTGI